MLSLKGKRIVITRPNDQYEEFAALLRSYGAEPIHFPTIEITPVASTHKLDTVLRNLSNYDWLIFTSVNGVQVAEERFAVLNINSMPANTKIASIGPKTAQALNDIGYESNFVPKEFVAEALLSGLGDIKGQKILLLRAEGARRTLPVAIRAAQGQVDDIAVYRTIPSQLNLSSLEMIKDGVDVITFTSPYTLYNCITMLEKADLDIHNLPNSPIFACIGPITLQEAKKHDFNIQVVAKEYTLEGLTQTIMEYFQPIEIRI